jgi:hypothetical protein
MSRALGFSPIADLEREGMRTTDRDWVMGRAILARLNWT